MMDKTKGKTNMESENIEIVDIITKDNKKRAALIRATNKLAFLIYSKIKLCKDKQLEEDMRHEIATYEALPPNGKMPVGTIVKASRKCFEKYQMHLADTPYNYDWVFDNFVIEFGKGLSIDMRRVRDELIPEFQTYLEKKVKEDVKERNQIMFDYKRNLHKLVLNIFHVIANVTREEDPESFLCCQKYINEINIDLGIKTEAQTSSLGNLGALGNIGNLMSSGGIKEMLNQVGGTDKIKDIVNEVQTNGIDSAIKKVVEDDEVIGGIRGFVPEDLQGEFDDARGTFLNENNSDTNKEEKK